MDNRKFIKQLQEWDKVLIPCPYQPTENNIGIILPTPGENLREGIFRVFARGGVIYLESQDIRKATPNKLKQAKEDYAKWEKYY